MYKDTKIKDEPTMNEDFDINESRAMTSKTYRTEYCNWLVLGNSFMPVEEVIQQLPAGYYNIKWDRFKDQYLPVKEEVNVDDLLIFPDNMFTDMLDDVKMFWESKNRYDKYNYVYKRGILLYGGAGCGKTSLIALMAKELIEKHNGIIISLRDADDLRCIDKIMVALKTIEPNRKIIIVIEDIDNFINGEKSDLTKLLNILDGTLQINNVVTIATTNFPEKLEERISNRPSRFDRRYEVGLPNKEVREYYITKKTDLTKEEIDEWVTATRGFTIDHIKELILSVKVLSYSFEKAIADIKKMMKIKVPKIEVGVEKIGFGAPTSIE